MEKELKKFNSTAHFKTAKFAKNDVLLYKGDRAKFAYKVIKGCLRSFVVDESGKNHTLHFAPEEWLITDMDSFFNNVPASIFIVAIEDTEVIVLDKMTREQMSLDKEDYIAHIKTLERNIIAANKRLTLLLSSTSKERYISFIETYPQLINRIPLKLIASYIGVTPEYLSNIRGELIRQKDIS